ncbi:MAG TPA: serine--tRNA ligase, partial [Dermatophilaceae bacterium]|nr:serine--tRNA ligase [Dermatophilaceae bacterium]
MIDIKLVRDNPDVVRRSQQARGEDPAIIDAILAADETRRSSLAQFEAARAEQKSFGKQVAAAAPADKPALLAQVKDLAERVKALDAAAATAGEDAVRLLASVPNVVLDGVPTGGEEDYVVRETVGTPRDFAAEGFEPRDHVALGESLGAIDIERGAKVAGARFYFLTGNG